MLSRGESVEELVVVLGGDRRYVMLLGDVEMMCSGFGYFVEQNGVKQVKIVGFGDGDDMYDVMMLLMCLELRNVRVCVSGSGESLMRVVYWGESDFYRRVLVEYGKVGMKLRSLVESVRLRDCLGEFDEESEMYMFECPQCMMLFTIKRVDLACHIGRHGTTLDGVPINPHASWDECMSMLDSGSMLGCGCPLRFVSVDSKNKYRVEKGLFSD